MSHLHLISTKFAFRHYQRERTRFQLSHNTRTHTKPHIKTCDRFCWPSQRRSVSLLYVVFLCVCPIGSTVHFYTHITPIPNFVPPVSSQRRSVSLLHVVFLFVCPVGSTVHFYTHSTS